MVAYIVRPELQKFQRRAWKAYHKRREHIEAMFGISTKDFCMVTMFYPLEHTSDNTSCSFEDDILEELADTAKEFGLKLIGTIHSHPGMNTCSHLSPLDVKHCLQNPTHEILTGSIHLFINGGRKYAKTQFSCLWEPVTVRYVTDKGKIRKS